jgi:hypothetical protein
MEKSGVQRPGEKISAGKHPFVFHGAVQPDYEDREHKEPQTDNSIPNIWEHTGILIP